LSNEPGELVTLELPVLIEGKLHHHVTIDVTFLQDDVGDNCHQESHRAEIGNGLSLDHFFVVMVSMSDQ